MNQSTAALQLLVVSTIVIAITYTLIALGIDHPIPWMLVVSMFICGYLFKPKSGGCQDFLVWKDEYATGIKDIDEDHKKLLNLINNLQACVLCTTGETFERHNLDELVAYTEYHFQREEKMMEESGYVNYEAHKGQHDQMILNVRKFQREYDARGREALKEIAEYLRLWLVQHINGTDQQYVPHFKEKGIN